MPNTPDLLYALNLPPEKAIEYFKSKGYAFSWNWHDIWQEAHTKVFTVAKAMRLDILKDIRDEVERAITEGITFREFQKNLEPRLKAKGWWGKMLTDDGKTVQLGSPWRLKTIYQTNLQTSYMAGRYKSLIENVDHRPYWQYVAVLDNKTRPAHRALHGKVFRWDDPIWNSLFPPNGWNCRCRVRGLSEKDIKRKGLKVESSQSNLVKVDRLVSKKTGEIKQVTAYKNPQTGQIVAPDIGWDYNVGKEAWKPDLSKYPPDLVKAYKKYQKEKEIQKLIRAKEETIKHLKIEKCFAFDEKGDILLEKTGSKDRIGFTEEEIEKLKNCAVFTHNHPSSRSFSVEDIRMACYLKLREMRVVGEKFSYTMKPPQEGWDIKFYEDKIKPVYDKINKEVYAEFIEKIKKGEMTIDEADLNHHHEVWKRVAKQIELYYTRTKE